MPIGLENHRKDRDGKENLWYTLLYEPRGSGCRN